MPDDGRRYEILDGEVAVTPAPVTHQRIVGNLYWILRGHVHGRSWPGLSRRSRHPGRHDGRRARPGVRRPRRRPRGERGIEGAEPADRGPVAEHGGDRPGTKLRLYARYGVPCYWIVDTDARALEAYELGGDGYRLAIGGRARRRCRCRHSPTWRSCPTRSGVREASAVIVYHIAVTPVADYVAKREPHRRAHIERLQGLRAAGILLGGGPSPDGTASTSSTGCSSPGQVKHAMEEDPYWIGGAWTRYEPRPFTQFVEPWEMPPVVLDGSRAVDHRGGPGEPARHGAVRADRDARGRPHAPGRLLRGRPDVGPDEDRRRRPRPAAGSPTPASGTPTRSPLDRSCTCSEEGSMATALHPVVGLITIGQSPRVDVVPEMAAVIGPGVDVREAGALDGLTRTQIDALRAHRRRRDPGHAAAGRHRRLRRQGEDRRRWSRRASPRWSAAARPSPPCSVPARFPADLEPPAGAAPAAAAGRAARHAVARPAGRRHPLGTARAADRGALAPRRLRSGRRAAVALRGGGRQCAGARGRRPSVAPASD